MLFLGITYADANKYFAEALRFATETGDRDCEATLTYEHCFNIWVIMSRPKNIMRKIILS